MTIGSLFSGVGGLELGLERAGHGPVLWQVEIDPNRRQWLANNYPNVPRYEDVRAVGKATLARVDLICGGFPCRGTSPAGDKTGLAHPESRLWYEYLRVVEEMRPRCVVVENVAGGATRWVDQVRGDLERLGYDSLPVPVSAANCGADHIRPRVFVVAYADPDSELAVSLDAEMARASESERERERESTCRR